ncbi:sensor histidine kinase [Paenibacillus daejeonensis]|uniref:sensor histidine kinase n=1 Tax=Paenibacillus daejeonensis TaxID=135193 RepID=UPI0003736142|nr:sensor histidine kinase [Paenibacillus daejeonensis]
MRLFLKEHVPLLILYAIQLGVVTLIYWLDGFRNTTTSLYAIILSSAALMIYLVYRYLANRSFYRRLEQPPTELSASGVIHQQSPLPEALQRLLASQSRLYQADLLSYRNQIDSHRQFINQWVHQMKTPLSVMHLIVQHEDDPRFMAIGDELDKMRKGLDMVLYTARLDTFEHDFHVEELDLATLIRGVVSHQKRLFIRSRIFPRLELAEGLRIVSDEKWLSFVMTQLITNAVRYTTREGAQVRFRSYTQDDKRVLEVEDEGVGIAEADLPRIFDPYFTGENGRAFEESTGMGLYLAHQICGKLGHHITISSQQNQGTVVRILF